MTEAGLDLNLLWYVLIGVLLIGYAVLDGFDLGVGTLHIFTKDDHERRILINSIGPFWDGNEVWLITGGGALFAAFPKAYATAFSGFYLAFMLVLFALILRAVALEFRSKEPMQWWRRLWDGAFFLGSTLASLLFGVAVGNLILGLPIDARGDFQGSFFTLVSRPYVLLTGALAVALFTMHGAAFLVYKTAGELQNKVRRWFWRAYWTFIALYAVTTVATIFVAPHMFRNFVAFPPAWLAVIVFLAALANTGRCVHRGKEFGAIMSSAITVAMVVLLFGIGMFPNLVPSLESGNSLTAYTAASSQKTLGIMAIIAALGMPLVLAYTTVIYWIFRGKVKLDKMSY
jgi:cytochrome d ubiquinol oxidase subunit II